MNRLEALLEALKEVDRHVEEMCKQHGHSYPASVEARQRAGEIEGAILAEKGCKGDDDYLRLKSENISLKAQNDLIAGECAKLEADNQRMDHENQDLRDEHRKQIDAMMSEHALRDELNELNIISGEYNGLRAEVQGLLAKDADHDVEVKP